MHMDRIKLSKGLLILFTFAMLLNLFGCKKTDDEIAANLESFEFSESGYNAGFAIRLEKGKLIYENRDEDKTKKRKLDAELNSEISDIFERLKVYSWDGFDESDNDVLDGMGFTLYAKFSDGRVIHATGSNAFPKNYDKFGREMRELFEKKGAKTSEEPIDGGVTDNNTDYDAPKEIHSDNLVRFSAGFYHEDKFDSSKGRYYTFILGPDSNGAIILKDSVGVDGFEVSQSVLDGVQTIIKKYDLAKLNGIDKITAGLPPEFEECDFCAEYDTGESIRFSENSDPSSEWGRELIDYLADIFAEHGDDQYLTSRFTGDISRFDIEIQKENKLYQYGMDGNNQIYRSIYDVDLGEILDDTYLDSDQEFVDGIFKIISEMEIRDFENNYSYSDIADENMKTPYFCFYIEFEDGDTMSGASADSEIYDKFMPLGTELMNYIDGSLNPESVDTITVFGDHEIVPVWNAYASSQLVDDDDYNKYYSMNLFDNDPLTAYAEGADDDGIGQMVKIVFGEGYDATCYAITRIVIRPGYQKSQDTFYNNSRPLKLGFYFSNGRVEYAEFDKDYDMGSEFTIDFEPVIAKDCIMVIEDAVSGKKYNDLCISEVTFYSQQTNDMMIYERNVESNKPSSDYLIEAYKGDEMVWSHMTHNPLTELSGSAFLTYGFGKVIAYDEQKVIALDAMTGDTIWSNEDTGFPSAYSFDSNGNLYICSYYGGSLCVIDPKGNTIRKEDHFAGEEYDWASMLILRPDGNMSVDFDMYNDYDGDGRIYTTKY